MTIFFCIRSRQLPKLLAEKAGYSILLPRLCFSAFVILNDWKNSRDVFNICRRRSVDCRTKEDTDGGVCEGVSWTGRISKKKRGYRSKQTRHSPFPSCPWPFSFSCRVFLERKENTTANARGCVRAHCERKTQSEVVLLTGIIFFVIAQWDMDCISAFRLLLFLFFS